MLFYFRLTGVYAFILCLHYTLYGYFQTAPQIKTTYPGANAQVVKEVCQKVWWKNLLYIGIYDFGLDQAEYPKMGVSSCHIRDNIEGGRICNMIIYKLSFGISYF